MYNDFPTIDQVHEILDEIAEELPKEFFQNLNGGVILLEDYKIHPESREYDELYVMGEYIKSMAIKQINIYYGSFEKTCSGLSINTIRRKLRDTLLHEFTHHLETLSGEKGLEIEDREFMQRYRERPQ